MKICEYGCRQEAKHQFKNGRLCCSKSTNSCPENKNKKRESLIGKEKSEEHKKKINKSRIGIEPWNKGKVGIYSEETKRKIGKANKIKLKGRIPHNKGKTYIELYGKEKAEEMKREHSKNLRGKFSRINNPQYLTISKIKKKYPFFSQIEDMRYNPDKPGEKEI